MTLSPEYQLWPLASIRLSKNRQRKDVGNIADLKDSISANGLLQPLGILEGGELIYGQRRLTAIRELRQEKRWTQSENSTLMVPVLVFPKDLDKATRQLIEFDENARRAQLTWQEEANAIFNLHEQLSEGNEKHTITDTGDILNCSHQKIRNYVQVGRAIAQGNDKVRECPTLSSASRVLQREINLQMQKDICASADALESVFEDEPLVEEAATATVSAELKPKDKSLPGLPSVEDTILQTDFLDYAQNYQGLGFNFIHCDFPYGIDFQKSEQGGAARFDAYADQFEVFERLTNGLLENLDKLMPTPGHIMFWYGTSLYNETLELLKQRDDLTICPVPMIWLKSDNKGIAPDVARQPRRIYETAFHITKGKAEILKMVSNAYSAPTARDIHPSAKPVPVLKHFLRMYLDEHSRVLDPTCGGGSSIIAAEDFNCEAVQGIELSTEYAASSRMALRQARDKRALATSIQN